MKKSISKCIFTLSLLGLSSLGLAESEKQTISALVKGYIVATSNSNTAALSNILHADYQIQALTEKGDILLTKDKYLGLIGAKKIGGNKRTYKILQLIVNERQAFVALKIKEDKAEFSEFIVLVYDGGWKFQSNLSAMKAKQRAQSNK